MSTMALTQRPAHELRPEQRRALYEEEGLLVFPQFLDDAELNTLRVALAEVLEQAKGQTESDDRFAISRGDDGRLHVRRIFKPMERHPAFRDLVLNPKILDVVEALIGPNIQFYLASINLKPPGVREAMFAWHQDYAANPHTNFDMVAVMVFLDDATPDNGCLMLVPGSHKLGPLEHRSGENRGFYGLVDMSPLRDPSKVVTVPVPAGGMELHHCNMVHASTANRGTTPRNAMVILYRAADNVAIGGSKRMASAGLLVRGEDPKTVRMVEAVVRLPR